MNSELKQQYINQIEFFIGNIKEKNLRIRYKNRLAWLLTESDGSLEVNLIALLNEVEEKEPKKYSYEEYLEKLIKQGE